MKVHGKRLEERLHRQRVRFFEKMKFQREAEVYLDFILGNEWLQQQELAEVVYQVDTTWFWKRLELNISNVPIEEFIENVLGPFHLRFEVRWELSFEGRPEEPIFCFKPTKEDFIRFRVKEGAFKQCKFKNKLRGFTEPKEASPLFELEMVCE